MKPLHACVCGATPPERIEPTGIILGGYLEWKCQCGKVQIIPWGLCSNELITRAMEIERSRKEGMVEE